MPAGQQRTGVGAAVVMTTSAAMTNPPVHGVENSRLMFHYPTQAKWLSRVT
jgi:hypothetical protein